MMDLIKTLHLKNKIVIISLVLSLLLFPCIVHAADLDARTISAALPYLTPNLDDARLYELASDIKSASSTTHDIDDIYNILVNIRAYVSNDVDILARLNDLTGYNTAYNTHSMLMDIWKRIGGNSTLSDSYTIVDLLNDINNTFSNNIIDNGLSVSNGAETYYISEILAGIYGQFSTPRSIPDLYNKLSDIQDDINDNFIAIANDTYSINSAIQRLADIYASNDVAQAKLNQQDYEDGAIADFTGSGTGAATTANKNDIKSISSTVKSGLNTGGSASNALGVFTFSGSNWDWFTSTTLHNLDTSAPLPDAVYYNGEYTYTGNQNTPFNIPLLENIPSGTNIHIEIKFDPTPSFPIWFYLNNLSGSSSQVAIIDGGTSEYTTNYTTPSTMKAMRFSNVPTNTKMTIYIYKPASQNRKLTNYNIPDFVYNHDRNYYNELLKDKK